MPPWLGIRHAQSTWNALARWQGQADPPLSEEGRRQARALAPRLAGLGLDRLVASDLRRARETAEILAEHLGLALELAPDLRERDVGAWSGLTHEAIAQRWPEAYARWRAGDAELRPGGGESRRALAVRVHAAVQRLRARHGEARLGLVTHMGVLRTLAPGARLDNTGTLWLEADAAAPEPAAGHGLEREAV